MYTRTYVAPITNGYIHTLSIYSQKAYTKYLNRAGLTSDFQFAENTMELGTGHTPNVDSVVVFKERHNLNPTHPNLKR